MHLFPEMSGTGKCPRGCIQNCIVFQDKCLLPFAPSGLGLRPLPRNEWHGVLRVQDVNGYMCSKKHEKSGKLKGLFIRDFITKQ
jgi:hypothetical protein